MQLFIILMSCIVVTVKADKVVSTKNGPVRGITVSSGKQKVEAYLSIPYAEPPVDGLRFMKPVPKRSWTGIYNASSIAPTCYQNTSNRMFEPSIDNMKEDCLYLNLWVPYSNDSQLKPILLFTHGGGFNTGSSNMPTYDGTNLARYGDVIVATVNYRVGAFGFFSAFIEDADGNMGMYDHILATKWIKDNAKSFGGDPERLVLMGQSAGAYFTAAHLISPLTRKLFKRVIIESGSCIYTLNVDNNKGLYRNSQRFAAIAGCANTTRSFKHNPQSVVDCLKRLPAQKLATAEGVMKRMNPITFYPRIGDAYMPLPPVQLIKEGNFMNAEMLIGMNEAEGTVLLVNEKPEYFSEFDVDRTDYLSKHLASNIIRLVFRVIGLKSEKEIAERYIGSIQNGTAGAHADAMAMALGDYVISCNTFYQAEYHSLRNPVYFYLFTYRPSSSPYTDWVKTSHAFELPFVFGNAFYPNPTPGEIAVSKRIMARWAAFAKSGNPDMPGLVKWPKYTREDPVYLDIKDEDRIVHGRPDDSRCESWRDEFQANIDSNIISKIKGSSVH